MGNYKLYKIEFDLIDYLNSFIEDFSTKLFLDSLLGIEREFTGVGAFVSFEYITKPEFYFRNLENKKVNGPSVVSDEFLHEVPVIYVFDNKGLLDYIEFSFGMKEKRYPNRYKFQETNINTIISSKEY